MTLCRSISCRDRRISHGIITIVPAVAIDSGALALFALFTHLVAHVHVAPAPLGGTTISTCIDAA